jgi:ribose/xylose/arabinose/galactoside ABC-type transport system permease subunit/ABC-type sugar transport system substrate-binding protein
VSDAVRLRKAGSVAGARSAQLLIITAVLFLVASLALGPRFANTGNFRAVLISFVSTGFASLGMMALLISGVFDLSVGSVYAIGMITVAHFIKVIGVPWPLAVVLSLAVCGACGAVNGFLVTKMKINALIATLGTMGILRGLAIIVGGVGVSGFPESFKMLGQADLLGVRVPVWFFLAVTVLFVVMFRYLKFFRKYYFVGGNRDAARLCGIDADRIWFSGFVIMSLLAGFAGILHCARLGSSTGQAGTGMEMQVIAGVVIGGASIKGGKGTILGGVVGALFMALVFNIMLISGVPAYWQRVVNGGILILAVYTDVLVEEGHLSAIAARIKHMLAYVFCGRSKKETDMRILAGAILVLAVALLVYSAGSRERRSAAAVGTADHSDELYIMATMYSAHPVLKPDLHYFHKKGETLGVRTLTVGPPDNNLELYVEAIEQAIAQKPDGLAINGLDKAIVDLIDKAMEQGIPVVLWDADLPQSKRITFIGTDWPQLGVRLAEAMAPLVGHKGKVGRLGNISQPHIVAAMDRFKTHMAEIAPDIEVLDVADDKGMIDVAESAASALIQRHPDIAGIAGFDGSSGGGICPAVKNVGKAGTIKVVINDLTPTHIEFLKDGSAQYVSGQKRNIFGPLALQVLFDIKHQGYAFTASAERDADLGIYQAPDKIDTGFIDVTTESVVEFEKAQQDLLEE